MKLISKIKYIAIEVLLIVATIVFAVMYVPHWTKGYFDIETAISNGETIKPNDLVTVKVDKVIDAYAETTTTKDGKKTDSNTSYMILLDNGAVLSLTAKKADVLTKLDSICDGFWEYFDGKTEELPEAIEFNAVVRKMSDDAKKYYDEGIEYYGINENEDFNVIYLDINTMQSKQDQVLVVSVLGIASVLYGAFAAFIVLRKR